MRRLLLVIAATAVALSLTGCAPTPVPELQKYRPGSGGTITIPTSPGERYAFDDITMCLDGNGRITITEVKPIEPTGGFSVDMFSVQPAQAGEVSAYVSDYSVPLSAVGYPSSGEMAVSTSCPADDDPGTHLNYTRLGIEVSQGDGAAVSTTRGIRVTYDSSGTQKVIDYLFGIALCDAESGGIDNPDCAVSTIPMD